MLGVVSQQCCFRLNVVAKRLTGFKRCATTPNNTAQQHATEWANGRNMQNPTMLGVVCRQFTQGFFLPYLRYVGLVSCK